MAMINWFWFFFCSAEGKKFVCRTGFFHSQFAIVQLVTAQYSVANDILIKNLLQRSRFPFICQYECKYEERQAPSIQLELHTYTRPVHVSTMLLG